MTLVSSGTITSDMIDDELEGAYPLVFPAANTLWLAGKAAAPIIWPTDFYGKTWGPGLADKIRFGAAGSPGSGWTLPSGAPWAVGDLVIVNQLAESASAPASVVPSGWTQIGGTATVTTDDGTVARMITSYRILTAGQVGSTVIGMTGSLRNRVCGMQLHYDTPVSAVQIVDASQQLAAGNPASITINWDSVRDAAHLYFGAAHSENNIPDANYDWSVAPDPDDGSVTSTRTYFKEYDNTAPAASIVMDITADLGSFNGHSGCLLRILKA